MSYINHSPGIVALRWQGIKISDTMLYLVAQLRPGAFEAYWPATIDKFKVATQRLKSLQLPWSSALRWCSIAVSSVLQYLLQFMAPSSQLLLAEAISWSSTASIPHQSISTACWRDLGKIGFGFGVRTLEATSMASRCRVALKDPRILDMITLVADQRRDDDSFMYHPFQECVGHSCSTSLYSSFHKLRNAGLDFLPPTTISLQAKVYKWLLAELLPDKLQEVILRRVQTVISDETSAVALAQLVSDLPLALKSIPAFAQVGFVRALFCAWNTRARYGDH